MTPIRFLSTLILFVLLLSVHSCTKDTDEPIEEPITDLGSSLVLYTNQTGDPNASAQGLQAQHIDNNTGNTVDFYGSYNELGEPDILHNLRITRPGSDTIVNLIVDQGTSQIDYAILEVNGEKLDLVVEFDFPQGDSVMVLSQYDYDWDTGTSELYYSGQYVLSDGAVTESPLAVRQTQVMSGANDWATSVAALGAGITIAEIAVATGVIAGTSLVGTAVGAVAAAVAAVGGTVIIGTAAVAAALASISSASAGELTPSGEPAPPGTPLSNGPNTILPVPLPNNPCLNNGVQVIVGADDNGEITAIAQGGTGDYTYNWSDGSSVTTSVSYHTIQAEDYGTYACIVTDENNCADYGNATWAEDGLSTSQKLIEWGPWRTSNLEIENNQEDLVQGFITLTFSGLDCECLLVTHYEYTQISSDQYSFVRNFSMCIQQGISDNIFKVDEAPDYCDDPESTLIISSISESSMVNIIDGDTYTCTPF